MINLSKLKHATLLVVFILLASTLSNVSSDFSKDKTECQEQLITLSSCISYVTGEAKAPSPQCCTILHKKFNVTQKCLCILVKDRNEPSLGLKLNATRALRLPPMCNTVNNPMDCLGFLHLNPKSPEAQIFIQSANSTQADDINNTPTSPMSNGVKPKIWQKMKINDALFVFFNLVFLLGI
ncbi:Protein YLS3 [Bienertia sinuspersici]